MTIKSEKCKIIEKKEIGFVGFFNWWWLWWFGILKPQLNSFCLATSLPRSFFLYLTFFFVTFFLWIEDARSTRKKMLIFIGIAFGKSKNMQDHFHLCCNRALNVLEQSSDSSIKHKQMHNGANDGNGEMWMYSGISNLKNFHKISWNTLKRKRNISHTYRLDVVRALVFFISLLVRWVSTGRDEIEIKQNKGRTAQNKN